MANVERIVPVGPTVRLELTDDEARGLLTLLGSGSDWETTQKLSLLEIQKKLVAIGIAEWEDISFAWVSELAHFDRNSK